MALPTRTENADYLGDGVYADTRPEGVVLTTENGFDVQNTIVFDIDVIRAFERYIERMRQKGVIPR